MFTFKTGSCYFNNATQFQDWNNINQNLALQPKYCGGCNINENYKVIFKSTSTILVISFISFRVKYEFGSKYEIWWKLIVISNLIYWEISKIIIPNFVPFNTLYNGLRPNDENSFIVNKVVVDDIKVYFGEIRSSILDLIVFFFLWASGELCVFKTRANWVGSLWFFEDS